VKGNGEIFRPNTGAEGDLTKEGKGKLDEWQRPSSRPLCNL